MPVEVEVRVLDSVFCVKRENAIRLRDRRREREPLAVDSVAEKLFIEKIHILARVKVDDCPDRLCVYKLCTSAIAFEAPDAEVSGGEREAVLLDPSLNLNVLVLAGVRVDGQLQTRKHP